MKQLQYNSSANVVRIEYPEEWSVADLTALTLGIKDKDGTALLAPSAATLYTATTLDAATTRFLDTITLQSTATALEPGDALLLVGVEGAEHVRVKGYDGTLYTAKLESILQLVYADADAVYGRFATVTVDTSVVATFTAGLVMVMTWTPTGTGQPITQEYQISKSVTDLVGIRHTFSRIFPRAYDAITLDVDRFADFVQEAERQVSFELQAKGLMYDRIVEQGAALSAIMYKMALLWTTDGDEKMLDERKFYGKEYDNQMTMLEGPLWQDHDQDGIEDEPEETTSHPHIFLRSWR